MFSRYSSLERTFRVLMRREWVGYVMGVWRRGGARLRERAPTLDERIAERVAIEQFRGRYDGPGSPGYHEDKGNRFYWTHRGGRPAAARSNGGLRGSRATRWAR